MKNRKILSFLTATVLVGQVAVFPIYAQENDKKESGTVTEKTLSNNGLMGYYFKDKDFKDLKLMARYK